MMKSSKTPFSLLPFLIVCIFFVELVYQFTRDEIEQQKILTLKQKLTTVFPISQNERLVPVILARTGTLKPAKIDPDSAEAWIVCKGRNLLGHILPLTTKHGYSGDIDLLIGLDTKQTIIGVSVLKHTETPGLGDKIERSKSPWLEQFFGHSKTTEWQLKQSKTEAHGFDAITAATITSKSIINLLEQTLNSLILKSDQTC